MKKTIFLTVFILGNLLGCTGNEEKEYEEDVIIEQTPQVEIVVESEADEVFYGLAGVYQSDELRIEIFDDKSYDVFYNGYEYRSGRDYQNVVVDCWTELHCLGMVYRKDLTIADASYGPYGIEFEITDDFLELSIIQAQGFPINVLKRDEK